MSEVQLEVPINGSAGNDQVDAVKIESNVVDDVQTKHHQRRKQWKKKPRYDGRKKKRQWEHTDRSKQDDVVDEKRAKVDPEDKIRRKKFCVILGYAGAKYIGMQRNPGVQTIEEELLNAMLKNELITEDAFQQPQYTHFQRAARTDKGVSAARQCISLKLPEKFDLDKLNADLPSDIKVFGLKRVTKGFNAKEKCNARTYSYTLPTISFAPAKESVDLETYRVDEATLAKVNETLQYFVGTHNFHNFTSRKGSDDPSANRYIYEFKCGAPFLVDTVEFGLITVKGQSFMLHQIRKMIGLMLAVVRGITPLETIERSFTEIRLDIPMAPGLGLVLDQVHYDGYNNRYGDDGTHEQLLWEDEEPAIEEFREKFIHPIITETEIKQKPMVKWLSTLVYHTYDERPEDVALRAIDEAIEEAKSTSAAANAENSLPQEAQEAQEAQETN